jgi:hypothetical protein
MPDAPVAIYAAVHMPGDARALIIEAPSSAVPAAIRYPVAKGLSIFPSYVMAKATVQITIELVDNSYSDIFGVLGEDLVKVVAETFDAKSAVQQLISRLKRWQLLLQSFQPKGLSENQQIGLFGELWFLSKHLLPSMLPLDAIRAWTAPYGSNQDFQIGACALEVKTTTVTLATVHISNIRQLDGAGLASLILIHISTELRSGSGETLNQVIDAIRTTLAENDPSAGQLFDEGLLAAGYLDSQSERYAGRGYHVRNHTFFMVTDGFPRLVENHLPFGIEDVAYTLDLKAGHDYIMSDEDAQREIHRAGHANR